MSKCSFASLLRLSPRLFVTFPRAFSISSYLRTHYDTLKLNPNASLKEVKDAYFSLSKKYHPDLHPNDSSCSERFIKLQEAYKVLSNPESRKNYDATIKRRTGYSYSSTKGNPRPYGHPDFTQRDEWLRADQERREAKFKQEFGSNEFNRFYSRPQNVSPEELEQYFKFKKANPQKFILIFFGGMMLVAVAEAAFSTYKRDHRNIGNYYDPHGQYRRYVNPYSDSYIKEIERRQRLAEFEDQRQRINDMRYGEMMNRNNRGATPDLPSDE